MKSISAFQVPTRAIVLRALSWLEPHVKMGTNVLWVIRVITRVIVLRDLRRRATVLDSVSHQSPANLPQATVLRILSLQELVATMQMIAPLMINVMAQVAALVHPLWLALAAREDSLRLLVVL